MNVPEGHVLIDGMLIDTSSGEVVAYEGPDRLHAVVQRRSWAKVQEDKWQRIKKLYDMVLLRPDGLPEQRMIFGDVDVQVAGRLGGELNGVKLANLLVERYPLAGANPEHIAAWAQWIASASGYRRSPVQDKGRREFQLFLESERDRAILHAATREYDIKWIETTIRREEAPELVETPLPKGRRATTGKPSSR